MYEGFYSYDDFAGSVSDGFTNCLNEFVPENMDLLCNVDGYSALCSGFTGKLSVKELRGVTSDQAGKIQAYLEQGYDLVLSHDQIVECIQGALPQAVGDEVE